MPMKIAEGFITVAEAAKRLGVSPVWIYHLLKTGALKGYRQGKTVIKETDLKKFQVPQELPGDQ